MSFNYNHITLVGRLANDPKIAVIEDTKKMSLILSVDRPYRKEDGNFEVDSIPVTIWGKLAEVASKYFKKGRPIMIEGSIQVNETGTFVMAENFQILERLSS